MQAPSFLALFFTIVLAAGIASCKGPEGPQGPAGAQGVAGAPGTQGPKGEQGNANVVTTAWASFNWDQGYAFTAYVQLYKSDSKKQYPLFTEEVMNNAAIYSYVKYKTRLFENNSYQLQERISATDVTTFYFQIPGRAGTATEDYQTGVLYLNSDKLGVNYFAPHVNLGTRFGSTDIPELTGKNQAFYDNLVKDSPQIRHVIVYGNPAGRTADINWDNYEEVKEALGLED